MSGLPVSTTRRLTLRAPAKVNLTLEVLRKRPDGYHDLASVMQTISLADTLSFAQADSIIFTCDVRELEAPDNLVVRAAHLLQQEMGVEAGARIHLAKRIPTSAGLGGGSSDGAAALRGLNVMWSLGLGPEDLLSLACQLGSDVPFFLRGGTVLVEGRGERLTSLPAPERQWLVLAAPAHGLPDKTAALFGSLRPPDFADGKHTRKLVDIVRRSERIESRDLFNTFEAVAFDLFPALEEARKLLLDQGLGHVRLSGAGPALYAIVEDRVRGEAAVSRLVNGGLAAYLVSTQGPHFGVGPCPGRPE